VCPGDLSAAPVLAEEAAGLARISDDPADLGESAPQLGESCI